MFYYKITKDNIIIDVNNQFFQYRKNRSPISCDASEANLICDSNENFYTTTWLKPLPSGAPEFALIDAALIDAEEYESLKKQLEVEEQLIITFEENEPASLEIAEDESIIEEKPMNAAEMRKRILELETLVNKLLNK